MAGDLERGVGALKAFQKDVNALLSDLQGGAGGSSKIAEERVTRESLGHGLAFAEADGFYTQYNRVHQAIVQLSKHLSDQIELYSIAVHAADVGYDNVEEEQRQRYHSILARLDEERDRAEAQAQEQKPETGKHQDGNRVGKDLG
ncbi:hypothetical protein ACIRNI_02925 [Streptomyces sp. NPDC093546]|uniref:hypothetical protein n=1 Tax=Streptomyces sp. NPDC093546 TaxID=3366040 RepID=UPI0038304E2A